jgi:hypothetical protein
LSKRDVWSSHHLLPDVLRVVTFGIGRSAVRSLVSTSRLTSRLSEHELRRLCTSEVTIGEFLAALPHLTLPLTVLTMGSLRAVVVRDLRSTQAPARRPPGARDGLADG